MNWLLHVLKMYIHCKIPWIILCFTLSVSLELQLFCSSFQIIHGSFIHVLYFISVPTIIISPLCFTRLNFFSSSTNQEFSSFSFHFLPHECRPGHSPPCEDPTPFRYHEDIWIAPSANPTEILIRMGDFRYLIGVALTWIWTELGILQ